MYPASLDVPDDARPRGDPAPPQGPQPHADGARPPRERQPVDDRQDREAADEPLVRRRAADHELPPGRAEEAGEEGARRPDPDAEGPVPRGEAALADGGRRDATLEVLSDAGHAQRPSGRLDLGQGDQQPHPERSGPEGPRADPRRRGHGARVPPGRLEGSGRAGGEPVTALQRGARDHAGRGDGNRHEVGPHEAPVKPRRGQLSACSALSSPNDNEACGVWRRTAALHTMERTVMAADIAAKEAPPNRTRVRTRGSAWTPALDLGDRDIQLAADTNVAVRAKYTRTTAPRIVGEGMRAGPRTRAT